MRDDGIAGEVNDETNPPGEIEDVSDGAHYGWKSEIGREDGGMLEPDIADLDRMNDAIAAGASDFDIVRFQGKTLSDRGSTSGTKSNMAPPGSIVPPQVMIGIMRGTADFKMCGSGFLG